MSLLQCHSAKKLCADSVSKIFNVSFEVSFNTVLEGGAAEPLYLPANESDPAKVLFRDDYVSSAMHEISHWVIAGEKRRLQEDYGYWYETDGRDVVQQKEFELVEVRPQAVEWLLHRAAGLSFQVSVDNLALPEYDASPFRIAVERQVVKFLDDNVRDAIPPRAMTFIRALLSYRGYEFESENQLFLWLAKSYDALDDECDFPINF